jgi:8-oxo-dGTP diphosphatase
VEVHVFKRMAQLRDEDPSIERTDPMTVPGGTTGLETRVGVGVLIVRDGAVLLGRRRGSHGAGTWAPPGGHLEPDESVEACARREAAEETGLALGDVVPGPWSLDTFAAEGRRYVTLFVVARDAVGEPEVREPEKCDGWAWFPWDALPAPLFAPLASVAHRRILMEEQERSHR